MSKQSETGHAINVANLERLHSFCVGYGTKYSPPNPQIRITELQTLHLNARLALKDLKDASELFNIATNTRYDAFQNVKELGSQLVNILLSTNASKKTIADAQGANRKLQGVRAVPKPKAPPAPAENPTSPDDVDIPETVELPDDKTISTSQQSYDQKIEHFSRIVKVLEHEPLYTPTELEFQMPALLALITTLETANTDVINATTAVSNSRIARNKLLYEDEVGIHALSKKAKAYIRGRFKPKSPEYQQVAALKFTKPR